MRSTREAPRQPLPGARHDARTRFFLFLLKGYAYLSLRLGDGSEARDALALLREVDPQDCVGASMLEAVRQRAEAAPTHDDDDDDLDIAACAQVTGASAWASLARAPGALR